MTEPRHLAICLPQRSHVTCHHAASLLGMGVHLGSNPGVFNQVSIIAKGSSLLPHLRCLIAEEAIEKHQATDLLWVDDDHSLPEDAVTRLLAHDLPIVGINASTRSAPVKPTARISLDENLYTDEHSHGLQRVYSLGFGVLLVRASVFLAMPKPWFRIQCDAMGRWMGEDAWFCSQARAHGFELYVDHDLTKDTAHYGLVGFHSHHAADAREET